MQALFMKSTGYDRRCHLENNHSRDLILGLLHAGAQKGSQPLRALIYVVHEHFQVLPRADIAEAKLLWISEAVAGGAFFLRKALQRLDSSLLETSIRKFRNHGGYNQFYAAFNRKSIEDILGHTSVENALDLNRKASLNSRGDKLLHILSSVSASPGLENILKLMDPREVNIANGYGETALYRACMVGETSNVLLLLSHGADPSIVPSCGGPTCLHWLFNFSPEEIDTIAKELVRHGSQIHSCSEQKIPMLHYPFTLPVGTPLHWAVEMSVAEAICSLLRLGADPSFRDGSDPYAYDENVRQLDMSLPPDLVGYSVAKNTTLGFSAIDVAVKNRDHEILDMLLSNDSGVDVNDTDEEGYSALHRLDAGEWRYTTQGTAVWCPLFQGPTVTREDSSRKTVAVLVQHGFELDKLTKPKGYWESDFHISGQTALMIAVAKGNCETIKILLDAGADVNIANTEGETALLSFTDAYADDKARQCKFVSLLLHANANLHARNSMHQTPVRLAALQGLEEVIMALLQHGADIRDLKVDTHARRGVNPWHYLSICQSQRIAEHDAWFVSLLDLHILPRLAQPDGLEIRNELLEKADPREGTLLHLFARAGLVRSCAALVQANVPINSLRRRKKFRRKEFKSGVTSISYMTPLDDSLKGGRPRPYGKVESEQGMQTLLEKILL